MSKEKELAKNTLIILIGKICTQFISFLLVPIYTRFLSTSDYGYIDLVQTYITLLAPILILRTDASIFRFLVDCRNDEKEKSKVVSSTAFVLLTQLLFFSLVFVIITFFFNIKYSILIFLNIAAVSMSSIALQVARGNGKMLDYSIASIISGLSTTLLNILFIFVYRGDAKFILISATIGNILCSLFILIREKLYRNIRLKNINKAKLRDMLKYSIPMIPDGLSWWIINASDRSMITYYLGTSFNGIYAISCKFSNIVVTFFSIFNLSWQESASIHVNDKDSKDFFGNIFDTSFRAFSSISLLVLIFTPMAYLFLIGKDYMDSYYYVPILLIGCLFNAMANVTGGAYIARKETKKVARTTITAAIINIVINLLLINKIGLWAASISTAIAYFVLFVYRYVNIGKEAGYRINKKEFLIVFFAFVISIFGYYLNNVVLCVINIILISIFCVIFNKEILKNGLSIIKEKLKK